MLSLGVATLEQTILLVLHCEPLSLLILSSITSLSVWAFVSGAFGAACNPSRRRVMLVWISSWASFLLLVGQDFGKLDEKGFGVFVPPL